ncbi:hypothetical protein SAMN03159340_03465 [Sphingomonas sp. NFR15]|nr:hypothetical protein SAMN03159340_03465 [Sphingomonas sp. NFR15]
MIGSAASAKAGVTRPEIVSRATKAHGRVDANRFIHGVRR